MSDPVRWGFLGAGSIAVLVNRSTDTGASHAIFAAVRDAEFGAP